MSDIATDTGVTLGWNGPIMVLDRWCGELDRRLFHEVAWPDLPRSMGSSHYSDDAVGTVDEIQVLTADDGTRYVWGRGRFTDTEQGRRAAGQVADGSLRTVSVEIRDGSYTEWPIENEEGETIAWAMEWETATIGAFALERNPAFAGAVIVPDPEAAAFVYVPPETPNPGDRTVEDDGERPDSEPHDTDDEFEVRLAQVDRLRTVADPAVVRAAGAGPVAYPARMFSRLDYDRPTRLTISGDGEVTGHVAVWGNAHRANSRWLAGPCGDLSDWLVGATALDDGQVIPTGVIVSDGLHAPAHQAGASSTEVARLIESTATQVATVTAWEDQHGLAVHGSTLPGVTAEQATRAMAGCPSIDQRDFADGRGFVTCGVLMVNTCGFKPGEAMVSMAGGEPVRRLVASAGVGCGCGETCSCQRAASADEEPAPEPEAPPAPPSETADLGRLARIDAEMARERLRAATSPKP